MNKLAHTFLFFAVLILTVGTANAAPGDLDTSFGVGGKVVTRFEISSTTYGRRATPSELLMQSDGKIVSVGYGFAPGSTVVGVAHSFLLARYNADGSLDTSFGNGGRATARIINHDTALTAVLQPDGKIIAAGFTDVGSSNFAFALARFNTNGSLDASFGDGGKVVNDITPNLDEITGIAVQPDGKIVVAGFVNAGYATDFAAARYHANGTLDTSFGTNGIVRTDFAGGVDGGSEMVLQADGKIVVAGAIYADPNAPGDIALIRYNTNGTPDATFGAGGKVLTDFGASENAHDMALAPDGKIVVSGATGQPGNWKFAAVRYNLDGSLDNGFDGDGKFVYDYPNSEIDVASAVIVQQNGKIVLAGDARSASGSFDFTVLRVNPNGSVDTAFGTNGRVFADFGNFRPTGGFTNDELTDVKIQADGKIVFAGDAEFDPNHTHDFALARFIGDPVTAQRRTAPDFDGDGKADISVFRAADNGWYISNSANSSFSSVNFGQPGDVIAPADFDGDGKTDVSIFRNGFWHRVNSSNNQAIGVQFGAGGDIPVPGDFDGDRKADLAVFRPADGTWYRLNSSDNQFVVTQFGANGDKPQLGDFDGDGKADLAIYRPANGDWYILRSSSNSFYGLNFGIAEDVPTPADYDGDGKADVAVYRPSAGSWYRVNSSNNQFVAAQFGIAEDKPAAADFDGDGKADLTVFRPSTGTWYLQRSTTGFTVVQFGASGDIPTSAAFGR